MDLTGVLIAINEARSEVQQLRTRDQSEEQRRLAILATDLEKCSAFAEYVRNSIPQPE